MSHQFFQNQSSSILAGSLYFSLLITSLSSHAQGLFQNFEKLLIDQKEKYTALTQELINKDFQINDIKSIDSVSLDSAYLNILIQNTPARYGHLLGADKCSVYDLLNTDLLKSPTGNLKYVVFHYLNSKEKVEKRLLPKNKFLNLIAYKQCPKIKKLKRYFDVNNARNTFRTIKIPTPRSEHECIEHINNFKKDVKAPYLCNIIEKIRGIKLQTARFNNLSNTDYRKKTKIKKELEIAKSFKQILSPKAAENLADICLNLNTPKRYCYNYFQQSYWTQAKKEKSKVLKGFCPNLSLKSCVRKLNRNKNMCHLTLNKFPALSPKPDCEVLSQALLKSRLYHQYNDCPSRVGNDAVTSFARVLSHFGDYDLPPDIHCETSSTYPFAKFSEEFSEFQTWQVNLCFINKINQNKKVCYPVLYDHIKGEKISLAETIKKLVYRLKGHSASSCKIITASEYKPELLKYKNGCHIIKDPMQCSGVKCTFKVMLNESEFTNYTSESKLAFNLFPVDFTNQNKSLKNIYQRAKQRTFKRIINVTSFINTFNQHKKSIFLGLGCAEEIYPAHFQRQALNQCSPLPFIVDGYFKDQDTYSLITRTSIDQIQAPRIIPWTQLFSALKHYQKLHPKNEWSFHAIY